MAKATPPKSKRQTTIRTAEEEEEEEKKQHVQKLPLLPPPRLSVPSSMGSIQMAEHSLSSSQYIRLTRHRPIKTPPSVRRHPACCDILGTFARATHIYPFLHPRTNRHITNRERTLSSTASAQWNSSNVRECAKEERELGEGEGGKEISSSLRLSTVYSPPNWWMPVGRVTESDSEFEIGGAKAYPHTEW